MDYTDYKFFEKYLKKVLTGKRFKHSIGVAETAEILAKEYGLNADKARFTGLVHDIAKCYSVEEMNRLIREYGISPEYLNNVALAHSKVGTEILREEFQISDEDILMGVSSHTTGRKGMSLFEEIIYVADAVEPNRDYPRAAKLRKSARTDIDKVCLELLQFTVNDIPAKGRELDRETMEAYEYIINKIDTCEEK